MKKKIASRLPTKNRVSGKMCFTVHKKSTPFKKPKNSGGSPNGVSEPPALETMKMKKISRNQPLKELKNMIQGKLKEIGVIIEQYFDKNSI